MIVRTKYLKMIADDFQVVPIVVLIGVRQVGKTSLMESIEVNEKKLFLNGQDAEIAGLFQKFSIIGKYLKSFINKNMEGYLMIDEFQYISGISTMMKLLTDKYPSLKILCSGNLPSEAEEPLAGRVRTIEITPLSFEEYIFFRDKKIYKLYQKFDENTESSALTAPISNLFAEYLIYGGLPQTAILNKTEDKIAALNNIYTSYLLNDLRKYVENKFFVRFNELLRILALQTGKLLNINRLSAMTNISYKKCEEYINLLEQMHIIKLIEPYETNRQKSITKRKKLFFCDTGLRNLIVKNFNDIDFRLDNGAIFENFVMLELWRNKSVDGTLNFFRTSDGTKVDFVLNNLKEKIAVESKYRNMTKSSGLVAFNRFCDDENIRKRYVVNKNLNTTHNGVKFIQGFLAKNII